MGVDAEFAIRFNPEPSRQRVKELQFHLMHRFGQEMFWTKTLKEGDARGWEMQDFIQPITSGDYYFDSEFDATGLWAVRVWSRYYGEGYERGPGLEFAGIIFYLLEQADVAEVFYGGDSSGIGCESFTKQKAIELFTQFCHIGRLPYIAEWKPEGPERPACSYCEIPMIRNGWGGGYAAFFCAGCGEHLTLRGADFDAWMAGKAFAGDREVKTLV